MSRELKIILWILFGIFIGIQLIPSNRPSNNPKQNYDFFAANQVPDSLGRIIRSACYNCHSQEVNYPWYAYVAPASWLVSRDVRMGRSHLDFSNWNDLEKKDKIKMASEIGEEVEDGSMPMPIYIFMHPEANLSNQQRQAIVDWTEAWAEQLFLD